MAHSLAYLSSGFREFQTFIRQEHLENEIEAIVRKNFVTLSDVYLIKRGTKSVVRARAEIVQLLRQRFPRFSLPELGRLMCRDHTTIMYAIQNEPKGHDRVAACAGELVRTLPRCAQCHEPATHAMPTNAWCAIHAPPNAKPMPHAKPLAELIQALGLVLTFRHRQDTKR